jgi:hypothetical protein
MIGEKMKRKDRGYIRLVREVISNLSSFWLFGLYIE